MSLPRETMLELMALADGELDGEAKERAERLVASSDEAKRVVEAMRGTDVSGWLRGAVQERAVAAGADRIADHVMAALGSAGSHAAGAVVRFDTSRQKTSRRRAVVFGVGCGLLAAAAAAAMVVRSARHDGVESSPVASARVPSVAPAVSNEMATSALARQAPAVSGVEVDEIDSPSRGVSVFEIPLGSAVAAAGPPRGSSVVIWIDDDPGAK